MSCSGFDRNDEWGFRALEPSRCCISSIALVLLKTGIIHHATGTNGDKTVTIDYNQMATAQKLLLFWRKPAVRASPIYLSCCIDSLAEKMLVGWYNGRSPARRGSASKIHQTVGPESLDVGA
jgi:hypothetical protein